MGFSIYTQTIVAINQVGGDVGFGTVPVDVTKLTAGNAIAVAIGGTDVGELRRAVIKYTTAPQIVAYAITYELGDGTATGNPTESNSDETIAEFFAKVTTMPTQEGFTFLHWSKTADGVAIDTTLTDKMSTLLDDPAGTTVTLYAVYEEEVETLQIIIGDVDVGGTLNSLDSAYLSKYMAIPAASNTVNNNRRKALINQLATLGYTFKGKETYDLADGSGTVIIGDVDRNGTLNSLDSAYLSKYMAIPAASNTVNNNRRKALIKQLADLGYTFRGKETETVIKK